MRSYVKRMDVNFRRRFLLSGPKCGVFSSITVGKVLMSFTAVAESSSWRKYWYVCRDRHSRCIELVYSLLKHGIGFEDIGNCNKSIRFMSIQRYSNNTKKLKCHSHPKFYSKEILNIHGASTKTT